MPYGDPVAPQSNPIVPPVTEEELAAASYDVQEEVQEHPEAESPGNPNIVGSEAWRKSLGF